MTLRRTFLVLLLPFTLGACGLLYTNIHGPYSYRSATPAEVHASPDDPVVTGESCNQSVLYLVSWGNAGYAAAAKDALKSNPNAIIYDVKADFKVRSILLGIYTKSCTILTGKVAKP